MGSRVLAQSTPSLRLGYAAITWEGRDEQAIDEIAAVGFRGIQLRSNLFARFAERPEELRARLEQAKLALLCFSSGSVDADPARADEYLALHAKHAAFVKALGGGLLQVTSRRPRDRAPTPDEFARLGALLGEIGRRTAEHGVRVVYHNHMNAFGEGPEEVARVLDAADPRHVSLLLDIAHYQQGGGDPVAAVKRHSDRLAILHLKDVVSPLPGDDKPARLSYRFVELGRGSVDVRGVVAALGAIGFDGPAVVELDRVPEAGRTAKQCAETNRSYLVETLGLSL
jgi:inosose dehydratase